jgi:hypothetical protein
VDSAVVGNAGIKRPVPFDDGVPGERDNVFRTIKQHLFPPDGGAARGEARFDQQNTVNQEDKR